MRSSPFARPKPGPVVIGLIAIVFGLFVVLGLLKSTAAGPALISALSFSKEAVIGEFKIWTLLTHVLVPSLVWFNVVINCFMLYMFASELEDWWGSARTLTFFVLCALGAGLLSLGVSFLTPVGTEGARPLVVAAICAWGLIFRDRQTSLFGIISMKGIHFVWLSLAIIVLDALSFGLLSIVPRVGAVLVAVALTQGLWRKNFVKVTWNDFLAKIGLRKRAKLTVVPPLKSPGKFYIN